MTRILVTGSEGFIPNALVRSLVKAGHEVTGLDVLPANGKREYRYVRGDIRSIDDVAEATRGIEVVYHLAAMSNLNIAKDDPLQTTALNVMGTANVAEVCRRNRSKLIFASSLHVYGPQNTYPVTEASVPNPSEIYAASKLAAEAIIKEFGVKSTILRLGTTFGPGMRRELAIWIFLSKALAADEITVFAPGTQVRQFVYIDDLVEGFLLAMKPEADNHILNLPGAEGISMLGLAKLAIELTGGKSKLILGPPRHTDITFEYVSFDKARYLIGWQPQVNLREGMLRTLGWIKESIQQPS